MLGRMKFRQRASWPRMIRHMVVAAAVCNALVLLARPSLAQNAGAPVRMVAYGDSLTAGYGLAPSKAFPAQLQAALQAKGYAVEIANAGVSGDTTATGLERFDWAVPDGTEAVILELGANDALRGLPAGEARENLAKIVARLKARDIDVLLAGMRSLNNWGPDYAAEFNAIYPDLAKANDLILYPFFLEGVAADKALNLDDGLHPKDGCIARIVEGILPKVEELIARVTARRAAKS
jgi:acyl-CoA thioesterase-1